MKRVEINIFDYVKDEKFWRFEAGGLKHYSCHDHAGSPYETDTDCGNCSGARCMDSEPRCWIEKDRFEFSYVTEDLIEALRPTGMPEEVILGFCERQLHSFAYNDDFYIAIWPQLEFIDENDSEKLEFRKLLETPDEELIKFFTSDPKYLCREDAPFISDTKVLRAKLPGPNYYDGTDAFHIMNQVKLYNKQFRNH